MNTPVDGSMLAPEGTVPARLYVNGKGGTLGSDAYWLMSSVKVSPTVTDSVGIVLTLGDSTGLTSRVNVLEDVNCGELSSATWTVNE